MASRPTVASIFRLHGPAYLHRHLLAPAQAKVLRAVIACRTSALGGHVDTCLDCGHTHAAFNSCCDRHCPGCQASAAKKWTEGRLARVLPTHYFHVVFTLPAPLRPVALANPKLIYDLFFAAANETLQELAKTRLDAQFGITAVLHTWTRDLQFHPHLHCVVTGGGLSQDGTRWVACRDAFLFPVKVMGALFRGKFLDGLTRLAKLERLRFTGTSSHLTDPRAFAKMRSALYRTAWVVYAKRPFGGPKQVIEYLSRYTHRVGISNSRIRTVTNDAIVISTRGSRTCTLRPEEFIRRFLLHVLPAQFRKIRHYGLLAPANVKSRLVTARTCLDAAGHRYDTRLFEPGELPGDLPSVPPAQELRCDACGGSNVRRERVPADARGPPETP